MSRSYRKSPMIAPKSAKFFKQKSNRALRLTVSTKLRHVVDFDSLVLPIIRELSEIYDSPKDGKCNMFDSKDDPALPKLMRK